MGKPFVPIAMLMVNAVLGCVGQLLLKYGSRLYEESHRLHAGQSFVASLLDSFKGIFTPYIFLGLCVYALSSILWIRIIRQVNLSFAYPMISVTFILVVIMSALLFREKVSWVMAVGLALICAGVSLIGIGYSGAK